VAGLDSVIFNWPDELFIKSKKDKKKLKNVNEK
jgi:hypothetical protein